MAYLLRGFPLLCVIQRSVQPAAEQLQAFLPGKHIHRYCLPDRRLRDAAWFFYAWGLDSFLRALLLVKPGENVQRFRYIQGRLWFVWQLITGNRKARLDRLHPENTVDL